MPTSKRFAFGHFVFDPVHFRLSNGTGDPIKLTPRLASALHFFLEHPGELLDKDRLLSELWPGLVVEENNLNQVISALRRTLGEDANGGRFIQTIPRKGYRFVANVLPLEDSSAQHLAVALPGERTAPEAEQPDPVAIAAPEFSSAPKFDGRSGHRSKVIGRRQWVYGGLAAGLAAAAAASWNWIADPERGRSQAATMVILPFDTIGGNESEQLLALGTADSLIATLSSVPGLVVKPLGVARQARLEQPDPILVARSLGTAWVLEGTLQRDGGSLRVAVRLTRTSDGSTQWSENFTTDYTSMLEVQDKISKHVVAALAPVLDRSPLHSSPEPSELGGTRSAKAYQLYLTARWRAQGTRIEDFDRAIALLTQALQIDPGYAIAWTELAHVHRRRLWGTDTPPAEIFTPAEVAIRSALTAAPNLPQAHAGRGFTHYWYEYDWKAAEREFRIAVNAAPSTAIGHWGLGILLVNQGKVEEGIRHIRLVCELEPMAPAYQCVAAGYMHAHGLRQEAWEHLERAIDLAPGLWLNHLVQGTSRIDEGQSRKGIESLRRAVELSSGGSWPAAVLAVRLARAGQRQEAGAIRNRLVALSTTRYIAPSSIAATQAVLGEGEDELALDQLERGLAVRDTRMPFIRNDPHYTSLRAAPRFIEIAAKLRIDKWPVGLSAP